MVRAALQIVLARVGGSDAVSPLRDTYYIKGGWAKCLAPLSFQGDGRLLSGQRVCATLPAFGGPGLPIDALPDVDGMLAPHRLAAA